MGSNGRRASALALVLGLAVAGCGKEEEKAGDLGGQFQGLTAEEQTHFDRMMGLDDVTAMHEECGRYASTMERRLAGMATACRDRMQAGRLSQENLDRWNGMADGMRARIAGYQQLCEAGTQATELQDLTRRHHQEMEPLFADMGAMMQGAGMMGGMMGGGGSGGMMGGGGSGGGP
jgi:hypothetical protein